MRRLIALILVILMSLSFLAATKPADIYDEAQMQMVEGNYTKAAELFDSISSYEDSTLLAMYCKALAFGEAGQYDDAISAVIFLGDFKDSSYLVSYFTICKLAYGGGTLSYPYPLNMIEAAKLFDEIKIFRDSAKKAEECRLTAYNFAIDCYKDKEFESAQLIFEELDGYKDSADQNLACQTAIKEELYQQAVILNKTGKYEEAYAIFATLSGYKDVDNIITTDENIAATARAVYLAQFDVGKTITFGSYEQDNEASNGKEDIEWLVLAREDNKALLISKYALDCQKYHSSFKGITWEECTLRFWLNNTFLDAAFSSEEQKRILTTTVIADISSSKYVKDPGNNTIDKLFLLSVSEANKYFSSDSARLCKATDYAVANGASDFSDDGNCWWWLRSPGILQDTASVVTMYGSIHDRSRVNWNHYTIRPALWINIDP